MVNTLNETIQPLNDLTKSLYGLNQSTEEWMVMTGDDNYYVPTFVQEMLNDSDGKHFIHCNMVHQKSVHQCSSYIRIYTSHLLL